MDVVVARCGLDVHKDTVVACVRTPGPDGGRVAETRTFGAVTVELLALRDWLVACSRLFHSRLGAPCPRLSPHRSFHPRTAHSDAADCAATGAPSYRSAAERWHPTVP